jgi:hypothetical protein
VAQDEHHADKLSATGEAPAAHCEIRAIDRDIELQIDKRSAALIVAVVASVPTLMGLSSWLAGVPLGMLVAILSLPLAWLSRSLRSERFVFTSDAAYWLRGKGFSQTPSVHAAIPWEAVAEVEKQVRRTNNNDGSTTTSIFLVIHRADGEKPTRYLIGLGLSGDKAARLERLCAARNIPCRL